MRLLLCVHAALWLLASPAAPAQPNQTRLPATRPDSFMIYDSVSFERIPTVPTYTGSKDLTTVDFVKDLSPYCPTPVLQGSGQTCVAISTAYGAYAVQRAIETGVRNDPAVITERFALSPLFPYKQLQPNCSIGLPLQAVAEFIKQTGDILYQNHQTLSCAEPLKTVSPTIQIKDFLQVFNNKGQPEVKVFNTKLRLHQNTPVIVGMWVRENFARLSATDDYYVPRPGQVSGLPGHAVVVVGYDDNRAAFKLLNSYGTGWGKGGFFWMKYRDFAQEALGGLMLVLPDDKQVVGSGQRTLGGSFGFRAVNQTLDGLQYNLIEPHHVGGGRYELTRKDWRVGQYFQLLTENTRSGEYMCVFSLDALGKVRVHYPRHQAMAAFNEKLAGQNESDILPANHYDLIIPGKESALMIEKAGTDYLCVLYSHQPLLSDLPAMLSQIEQTPGDIQTRISRALGSRLVRSDIAYHPDRMDFTTTFKQGDTVPIVLTLQSVER